MRIVRTTGIIVGVLVLLFALYLLSMRLGMWNPSYESVKAKYADAPSKFVKVGDVTLHVRDEGQGPTLLMLHSSMSNLRIYDGWADRLKKKYRVVRIDWPPYGLSLDPKPSTGMAGIVPLVHKFVEQEKLSDMTLIGSSSGSTLSVLYAAAHPDKVRALALSALPLKAPPPTESDWPIETMVWIHENIVPNYYPRYFYQRSLESLYGVPSRLKPETVDWYWATNNLPGGFARVKTYYKANTESLWKTGAASEASSIKVPILLQWGDRDRVLPRYLAGEAVAKFSGAKVSLIHYPDVSHYPMIELPNETGADLEKFLDGVYATGAKPPVAAPAANP